MAKTFENFTIYQILRYDAILQNIINCPMLTVPFYRSVFNSCSENCGFYYKIGKLYPQKAYLGTRDWRPSFESLKKNGFIEIKETETYNVYVENDSSWYNPEVINMTDEQYNNLPEYFKDKVEIQTRKRNIYVINEEKIKELHQLAMTLHPFFN